MSPVIYAPRMKVIQAFGGTFPITEKVIYTFLLVLSRFDFLRNDRFQSILAANVFALSISIFWLP